MKTIRILVMVLVLAAALAGLLATPTATDASNHRCAWFGSDLIVDYTTPDGGWFFKGGHRSDSIKVWLSKDGTTVFFSDRSRMYLGPTAVRGVMEGSFPVNGGSGGQYQFVDRTHNITRTATNDSVEIAPCP